jgi:hypothetical protein
VIILFYFIFFLPAYLATFKHQRGSFFFSQTMSYPSQAHMLAYNYTDEQYAAVINRDPCELNNEECVIKAVYDYRMAISTVHKTFQDRDGLTQEEAEAKCDGIIDDTKINM